MARGRGLNGASTAFKGDSAGAIPFVFHKYVTGSTTAWTIVNNLPFSVRVIDFYVVAHGSNSSGTAQLLNGSTAISDAVVMAVADTATRAATLDNSYVRVLQGGKLALTTANSAQGDCYVVCLRDDGSVA